MQDSSCRGFRGVPQTFKNPPSTGDNRGLDDKLIHYLKNIHRVRACTAWYNIAISFIRAVTLRGYICYGR
jgi:hypothetical protein